MSFTSFLEDNKTLVCGRYSEGLAGAKSKKALADMLDVNVLEWLCMMQPRHGSAEWLSENFSNFTNGKFVKECGGYSVEVWCRYDGEISLRADVTALVGCGSVKVRVPDNAVMRVFCSGGIVYVSLGENASLHVDASDGTEVVLEHGSKDRLHLDELKTL